MPIHDRSDHRTVHARVLPGVLALLLVALAGGPAAAAERPVLDPPYENLQVLPADTSRPVLMETMKGFSQALGVRCHHCHVGEEGRRLSEYDFAADTRPAKAAARVMMGMVRDVNGEHLSRLADREGGRLSVGCLTCHHGKLRPESLEQALLAAHREGGVEAAIARYRDLRQRYYGGWAYDFGELSLLAPAQRLQTAGDPAAALALLRLNLEHHPESAPTHFALGEVLRQQGEREAAVSAYRRALELDPELVPARRRLDELGSQSENADMR